MEVLSKVINDNRPLQWSPKKVEVLAEWLLVINVYLHREIALWRRMLSVKSVVNPLFLRV